MQTEKAIPFIIKHNNNYQLTAEAENFLNNIHSHFSVVTVAGLYRTGKSYLLNKVILDRGGAFGVGPTVNPCTKGLWIWAQPIVTPSGKTLLVVDTEGLGALDEENNHDMKIFCLAVLLSSTFIYNSVGSIDEQALQTLSFVLNLVASIDQSNYSNKPNFLWVVRDFALQLINDSGEQITSNQYLQMALNADIQKQANKKQLRKTILDAFSERKCFTLIKPLIDQQKLQNLDQIPQQQLRPEFLSQTKSLRNYIIDSLKQFKMNGTMLTGKQYVVMIKRYLEAINNNAIPDILDTWGYIKQAKEYSASEQLQSNYIQRLNTRIYSKLPMPTSKLVEMLSLLKTQLISQYLSSSYEQTISPQIQQYFLLHYHELERINNEQTLTFLNENLKKQYEPFYRKLVSNYYTQPNDFQNDIRSAFKRNIQDNYADKIDIPCNHIQLYTEKRISECIRMFLRRSNQELHQISQMKAQIESVSFNGIKNQSLLFNQQRQKLHEDMIVLEKRLMIAESERNKLELILSQKESQKDSQSYKYQRKIEQNQNQIANIQAQMQRLQLSASQAEKNVFTLKKQLQKEKALSCQKIGHLQNQLQESQRRQTAQHLQFSTLTQSWQHQKRKILHQMQLRIEELNRQKKQQMDQSNELIHQVEQEQFVSKTLRNELQVMRGKYCEEVQTMKQKLHSSSKKDSNKQDNQDIIKELGRIRQKLNKSQQEYTLLENKHKFLSEELKVSKSHNDKQQAIHMQTIEFKQQELTSLKEKYIQFKNAYEKQFSQPNNSTINMEITLKKKIKELEIDHLRSLRDVQDTFESKERNLKQEISRLLRENQELEIKVSLERKCKEEGDKQLRNNVGNLQQEYQKLMNKYNISVRKTQETHRENNKIFANRVKMLEEEIEILKQKSCEQLAEQSKRSQGQISMIRQYLQTERLKLEKKMQEVRQKSNRKEKQISQEWTRKIAQERQQFEQTISQMQEKEELLVKQYSEDYQTMKCDFQIKIQKLNNASLEQKIQLNKKYALLQQEYEMSRQTQMAQMQEKTKNYHMTLQNQKKQMVFQFQQQIQCARSAMQELQGRNQQLKKSLRKVQQGNMLLKSQSDKEKALHKQKQANYNRKMKQLQERYSNELKNHTRLIQQLNSQHVQENKKMNGQIQRLREELSKLQDQKIKLQDEFSQQRNSLITKHQYMESKWKRAKQDHQDILKKFQTTVKSFSNQKNQKELQKQMEQSHKRLKEQYNKKIAEKQESINQEKKENQQKIKGLQTENKSLRDKLLMYEMRQSSISRYETFDSNQKEMYEKVINELRQQLQKEKMYVRKLVNEKNQENSFIMQRSKIMDQKEQNEHIIRLDRSKLSDKDQHHSFLNEDYNQKTLHQNKSLLNRKPGTSIKKAEKRITNLDDFGGIMKWKNQ